MADAGAKDPGAKSITEEFLALFTASQPRMQAYLRSQLLQRQDVDDVFQEVAIVLWRNFDRYERDKDFTRWACGIIRNQVLANHRRRRQFLALFREEVADAVGEEMLRVSETSAERLEALRECVGKLTPSAQDLLRRRYRSDKSVKLLAAEMGRTESALFKALKRIHEALRDCIESWLSPAKSGPSHEKAV